jgi:PAS domain S-box-containing protein
MPEPDPPVSPRWNRRSSDRLVGPGPEGGSLEEAVREREFFFEQSQRAANIGSYKADFRNGRWASTAVLDDIFGIDGQFDRTTAAWLGLVHPLDRAMMEAHLTQDVIAGRHAFAKEYRIVRVSDGAIRWVNGLGKVSLDPEDRVIGLIGTIQDITERKEAEEVLLERERTARALFENLRESESRYRTQFDLASEGIITHTPGGDILEVNEAFARMHGYEREDMLHMWLRDLNQPGTFRTHPDRLRRLLGGEAITFEVKHVHKDGHVFPLEVSASTVTAEGRTVILAFHRDITERKRVEEEKIQLEARLQQAQRMESLGSLAGGVAHDMNNVLGAILGLASANLEIQPEQSRTYRAFETISRAAVRGGEMVKSLLTLARQNPVEERDLDLNGVLREEIHLLERTTLAKVRLVMDLAPELRPMRGDASALTHAFMNLCVNAVDAMPEQGTLTIRSRNLDGPWLEVQVEDTGCGMAPDVLARALDPFYTTKPVGKGTGLGLSMVYTTVKAHLGHMVLQSQPGEGTRVIIRFPACPVGTALPKAEAGGHLPSSRPSLAVLLVDDDELIQNAIQELMEVMGHRLDIAASGEEALLKVEAGLRPDVVILDMSMPGLGGAGTLPPLRALLPAVPILVATGRADQATLDLVASGPNLALLAKPFSMGELQKHLGHLEAARI